MIAASCWPCFFSQNVEIHVFWFLKPQTWFDALLDLSGFIRFIHQWTKTKSKFCSFNVLQQSRAWSVGFPRNRYSQFVLLLEWVRVRVLVLVQVLLWLLVIVLVPNTRTINGAIASTSTSSRTNTRTRTSSNTSSSSCAYVIADTNARSLVHVLGHVRGMILLLTLVLGLVLVLVIIPVLVLEQVQVSVFV